VRLVAIEIHMQRDAYFAGDAIFLLKFVSIIIIFKHSFNLKVREFKLHLGPALANPAV
jgi:hypothetical protein